MSKIAGKDVILYIAVNASPEELQPVGCSRTCVLTTNAVTAGVSTIGSGIYSEFKALSINWIVSVDGLATFGENADLLTLRGLQFALQPVIIVFNEQNADAEVTYKGYAIITSVVSTGNYNDVETYSVQLQGTGELQFGTGDYPDLFQIIDVHINEPTAGQTTLDLVWNAADPVPDSYTVKQTDLTTGITTFITDIPEAGHFVEAVVDNSHSYTFAIQSVYSIGASIFSPTISYTSTPHFIVNSNGDFIINSNTDNIINV